MPSPAGREAQELTHVEVLARRRAYLKRQIKESAEPGAWDRREVEALDWAIKMLDGKG